MKRPTRTILFLIVATLIFAGCSHKGVHMSKHRKSRKCNCPTFAETAAANATTAIVIQ